MVTPIIIVVLLAGFCALVVWLVMELRSSSKTYRLVAGVLAFVGVGFITHFLTMLSPSAERYYYTIALRQMEGLLGQGESNRVSAAIHVHNAVGMTGTVLEAAQSLSSALSTTSMITK